MTAIVIATPHKRHDDLEAALRIHLSGFEVIRMRSADELTRDALAAISPVFVFLPHWSAIIPADVYNSFPCVVFHMTDLPYGRGGSPLQNLIVRGHTTTMLSALRCVRELDAGPVYLKRPLSLAGTAEEILQRATLLTQEMIHEIVTTKPEPVPQSGAVVKFTRRKPSDGDLSPLDDLTRVECYIRMLDADGYPPAFIETPHLRIEFTAARRLGDLVEATARIRRREE